MSKQTAMQELIDDLQKSLHTERIVLENKNKFDKKSVVQAKIILDAVEICIKKAAQLLKKEKEQIIDARISVTGLNHRSPTDDNNLELAEQYFNQTYNQ